MLSFAGEIRNLFNRLATKNLPLKNVVSSHEFDRSVSQAVKFYILKTFVQEKKHREIDLFKTCIYK